jgi:N-methylhydantoinase A/oxoprolinase/acetone carboxylase beta subunit
VRLAQDTSPEFLATLHTVMAQAGAKMAAHGVDPAAVSVTVQVDVRFAGQEHMLTVPVSPPGPPSPADEGAAETVTRLRRDFHQRHIARYGQADADRDIEVVTVRATALAAVAYPELTRLAGSRRPEPRARRPVWLGDAAGVAEADIWDRADLPPGFELVGPSVIEEWNSTTVVGAGQSARVDPYGNLVIERCGRR